MSLFQKIFICFNGRNENNKGAMKKIMVEHTHTYEFLFNLKNDDDDYDDVDDDIF